MSSPGEQTDASGLQYLRARYYNPALGSFLTRDPVMGVVGDMVVRWNPYVYAGANPVNHTDPSGQMFEGGILAGLLEQTAAAVRGFGSALGLNLDECAESDGWLDTLLGALLPAVLSTVIGLGPIGDFLFGVAWDLLAGRSLQEALINGVMSSMIGMAIRWLGEATGLIPTHVDAPHYRGTLNGDVRAPGTQRVRPNMDVDTRLSLDAETRINLDPEARVRTARPADLEAQVDLTQRRTWYSGDSPQPRTFTNQISQELDAELEIADNMGVQPIRVGTDDWEKQLQQIVNDSDASGRIKWVVDTNDELIIIPHEVQGVEINHTVCTRGEHVCAAGEANVAGFSNTFFGIEINRHSGHYMPDADSLDIGIEAFRRYGIEFGIINRAVD